VPATKIELVIGAEPYPGYHLVKFLGRGGWGAVWKATTPDGKTAALKFMPSDSPLAAVQEVRALQNIRQLHHPNMLRMENIWSCEGYLVLAMELADGSLHDLLDVYYTELNAPIPPDHVCFFLSQAAAAIDFLNQRQHHVNGQRVAFRHCDIKPSNLLVVGSVVKLADFSLAVQTTSPMWHHRRAGTLDYAAPEVFQGWLSDRSDLYGLAAAYYQLRTGKVPFPDTPRSFHKGYTRPVCPDVSMLTEMERPILARAFAPVPQDRWPTCGDFMSRLTRCFVATPKAG
jgi:serine/threonine protein kinase